MAGHGSGARGAVGTVAALALAALALAGCGSDGGGSADAPVTTARTQTQAPAPSGSPDAPRAVVERYLAAVREGDGEAACETLSRRLLASFKGAPDAGSCAASLDAVRAAAQTDGQVAAALRGLQSARVGAVEVRGDLATARYGGQLAGGAFEDVVRLVREDGRWVLDTLGGAASGQATPAGSGCPIDAAAVSAALGTRVETLPIAQAGCHFGRPGGGDDGEDPRQPSVRIGPFPYADLAATKARLEAGLDAGQRMLDRPRWGRDAFMVTIARGDDVTATAIVPTAGGALVAEIVLPRAKDDLDRVADRLVAAIQRG